MAVLSFSISQSSAATRGSNAELGRKAIAVESARRKGTIATGARLEAPCRAVMGQVGGKHGV